MRRTIPLLLLIVASVLALPAPSSAATYVDVPATHSHYHAIEELSQMGVVDGYGDGRFGPNDPVCRAQFAKMIVGLLGLRVVESDSYAPFVDLGPDDNTLYPHEFVAAAHRAGITKGTAATTFAPFRHITVGQLVTMVVRAADRFYPGILARAPSDYHSWWPADDPTHGGNIARADYTDLLAAFPSDFDQLDPYRPATRGEVAQILVNLLQKTDGAWDKSSLSLAELQNVVQATRGSAVYLPATLPAGWALAEPYQVGPVSGWIGPNPEFYPAAAYGRTGYWVTFTNGPNQLTITVDPVDYEFEIISDWDWYENPTWALTGSQLEGEPWQVLYTSTSALTYVVLARDIYDDDSAGIYIWSRADERALALDFAQRMERY